MKKLSLVAFALLLIACPERRKPLAIKKDAGPSVVVVDKKPITPPPTSVNESFTQPLDDEKEPDDKREAAQPITAGHGVKGELALLASDGKHPDEDWYSLLVAAAPAADTQLELWAEVRTAAIDGAVPGSPANAAPLLEAFDGNGQKLWLASGAVIGGDAQRIPNLGVLPGQTYYLRVRRAESKVKPTGALPYSLLVQTRPSSPPCEVEPNDTKETANVLAENVDLQGRYSRPRDEDYYRVKGAAAPAILRVEISAVPKVAAGVTYIPSDVSGTVTIRAQRGEELRIRNLPLPANLDSLLGIRAAEGRNDEIPYVVRITSEAPIDGCEKEPNDRVEEAFPLKLPDGPEPTTVSGFLWMGDVDTYRIIGVEGNGDAQFRVELDVPAKVDLKIERIAATGQVTTKIDTGGLGHQEKIEHELVSATPLFRVRGRPKDVLYDEPYTLRLYRIQ